MNLLSVATVEQSIQYLNRHKSDMNQVAAVLIVINASETGFSFCKENCGALIMRVVEYIGNPGEPLVLSSMFFSSDVLAGRNLQKIVFDGCHFQPTSISNGCFAEVEFKNCEFERIEIETTERVLQNCTFSDCRIDSLVLTAEDDYSFDPTQIAIWLQNAGAQVGGASPRPEGESVGTDERFKVLERFLRVFLRSTQVDEEVIRLRLGNASAPHFFEKVLPALLDNGVLEGVPWKGRGVQHRYKLMRQMSDVSDALEYAHGSFDGFLAAVRR